MVILSEIQEVSLIVLEHMLTKDYVEFIMVIIIKRLKSIKNFSGEHRINVKNLKHK